MSEMSPHESGQFENTAAVPPLTGGEIAALTPGLETSLDELHKARALYMQVVTIGADMEGTSYLPAQYDGAVDSTTALFRSRNRYVNSLLGVRERADMPNVFGEEPVIRAEVAGFAAEVEKHIAAPPNRVKAAAVLLGSVAAYCALSRYGFDIRPEDSWYGMMGAVGTGTAAGTAAWQLSAAREEPLKAQFGMDVSDWGDRGQVTEALHQVLIQYESKLEFLRQQKKARDTNSGLAATAGVFVSLFTPAILGIYTHLLQ
jgi:hypothetical protein